MKCGHAQKMLGDAEKTLVHTSAMNFLKPLSNFLEGDCKTIQKERKTLETKRLDLDACKSRVKKAKSLDARQSVMNVLDMNAYTCNSHSIIQLFFSRFPG